MKNRFFPRSVLIALCIQFVAAIFAIMFIIRFGRQHNGLVWGIPSASLVIAVFAAFLSVTGLVLTISKYRPPKRLVIPVGGFPKHLSAITRVVENAKAGGELLIMADSPDYGSLGGFEDHLRLLEQIKKTRRRGVRVSFMLLGPPAPVSKTNPFSEYTRNFEHFSKSEAFIKFFKLYFPGLKEPQTLSEFDSIMLDYMIRIQRDLADCGVEIYQIPSEKAETIPVFLWSAGTQAIILNIQTGKSSLVTDREVIKLYETLFRKHWKLATENLTSVGS